MTAKEYLNQARYLDREIDAKLDHVEKLNSLIYKATSTLTDMPGSPTRDHTKRERAIAKVIDLQREIDSEIDRLVDLKKEINSVIQKIPDEESRLLLELRYINLNTWEDIAAQMDYTVRAVHIIHGRALTEVEKLLMT